MVAQSPSTLPVTGRVSLLDEAGAITIPAIISESTPDKAFESTTSSVSTFGIEGADKEARDSLAAPEGRGDHAEVDDPSGFMFFTLGWFLVAAAAGILFMRYQRRLQGERYVMKRIPIIRFFNQA